MHARTSGLHRRSAFLLAPASALAFLTVAVRPAGTPRFVKLLFLLAIAAIADPARGAVFCVGTSAELQQALSIAAGNGEADSILIESGTYTGSGGSVAFAYSTSEDFAISISGGYVSLPQQPCYGQRLLPTQTILSGSGARRVVQILGGQNTHGDIAIWNLTIRDGYTTAVGHAGGLETGGSAGYDGNVVVTRTVIANNTSAQSGSGGLSIGSSGTVSIRNNLFVRNRCASAHCAFAATVNTTTPTVASAFIGNNTIVANTCAQGASCSCTGARIGGSARSVFYNNAFALNSDGDLCLQGGPAELFNNAIDSITGTPAAMSDNLPANDLLFTDVLGLDFRPMLSSPLVNHGTLGYPLALEDLDNHDRISEDTVDIGAYESIDRIFADSFESTP